jgi:hypothetical protein
MMNPIGLFPEFGVTLSFEVITRDGEPCLAVKIMGPRGGQLIFFYESDARNPRQPSLRRAPVQTEDVSQNTSADQEIGAALASMKGDVLKG